MSYAIYIQCIEDLQYEVYLNYVNKLYLRDWHKPIGPYLLLFNEKHFLADLHYK